MITTNDDELAVICRAFKEHGMAQNGAKARYILHGIKDDLADTVSPDGLYNPYKYYNYLIAYNSRMDAIAEFYESELGTCDNIITPKINADVKTVWHQYAFRCERKDEMGNYLASKGVGSAAFYPVPLHLQKAFEYLGYKEGDLPVAEKLTKQTVCLPIFPELTKQELQYIIACIKEFFV